MCRDAVDIFIHRSRKLGFQSMSCSGKMKKILVNLETRGENEKKMWEKETVEKFRAS
jgi:hypothetical protein